MPLVGSKGKVRAATPLLNSLAGASSAKRRREEDEELRSYDLASESVANFLHPGGPSTPFADRPITRRRLDFPAHILDTSQTSTDSAMSASSSDPNESMSLSFGPLGSSFAMLSNPSFTSSHSQSIGGVATAVTPPSPTPGITPCLSSLSDPFSYLDDISVPAPPVASTSRLAQSMPNALFATPSFLESPTNILTYSTPIHSHAFMTFGAGKRQKEIDQFSAENPLEAVSLSGGRGAVPYHIPS